MDRPTNYRYAPLGPQELRLLRAVHEPKSRDLRFDLIHNSRGAAPRYTAVSYTWGDQEPTNTIRLEGKLFYVRPNLWSCLYYLSQAQRGSKLGWDSIWVDAICINQQDDSEKSHQVSLMQQTYAKAQSVSVWLGLEPYPTEHAIPGFPSLEQYSNGFVGSYETDAFDWTDHLDELLNRPYWSRFWVIQEFLVGHDVHLYCSANMIDWQSLRDMLERRTAIDALRSSSHQGFRETVETASKTHTAASLILARHPDMYPELPSSLHELLIRHRSADCKDRRDRVFALLGLLSGEEHGVLSRFFPNYALTEDQVCTIALAHLIHFGGVTVTASSGDIFQSLGVKERQARAGLLAHARYFDYLGDWTSVDVPQTMSSQFQNDFWEYGTFGSAHGLGDVESADDLNDFTLERRSASRFVKFLVGVAVVAAIWVSVRCYS